MCKQESMMEPRKAVSIYLRPDLIDRVEAAAKADGRSVSNYIERVLDAVTPRVLGDRVVVAGNASESPPLSQYERERQATNRR
jgi:hypothetical protein